MAEEFVIDTLIRSDCLACGGKGNRLYSNLRDKLFGVGGFWNIDQCKSCGLLWLNPYPSNESLEKLYGNYYTHDRPNNEFLLSGEFKDFPLNKKIKYSILAAHYKYKIKLPAWYYCVGLVLGLVPGIKKKVEFSIGGFYPHHDGNLLDLGCGNGDYLLEMKYLGWKAFGLEIDGEAADIAKQCGLDVKVGELSDDTYRENFFDAIHMNNVIEHLSNPEEVMKLCHKMLKPGGILSIKTCNSKSVAHAYYKESFRGLEIPRHFFIFSPKSLKLMGDKLGYRAMKLRTSLNQYIWLSSHKIKYNKENPAIVQDNKIAMTLLKFLSPVFLLMRPKSGDDIFILLKKV
jgi:2-polyprenyl-3-methyl-5-hydroxy-6-metoxy-1,4-benzoquinol methylase